MIVVSRVIEVDHRRVEELLFTYLFPVARFIAWVFTLVGKYNFVVSVLLDVILVNSVLEVASLIGFPLRMKPMFFGQGMLPKCKRARSDRTVSLLSVVEAATSSSCSALRMGAVLEVLLLVVPAVVAV